MELIAKTDAPKEAPHPFCFVCNWRKGGIDSWDGVACKCGHSEPPIRLVDSDAANPC